MDESFFPKAFVKYLETESFHAMGALIDWSAEHYLYSDFLSAFNKKFEQSYSDNYITLRFCGSMNNSYYKFWFNGRRNLKNAAKLIESVWNNTAYGEKFNNDIVQVPDYSHNLNGMKPASKIKITISDKPDICTFYSLKVNFETDYITDKFGNKYRYPITEDEKADIAKKIEEIEKYETLKTLSLEEKAQYILDKKIPVLYDKNNGRLYTKYTHFYKNWPTFFHLYLFTLDDKGNPKCIEDLDQVYKELDNYYRPQKEGF